MVQAILKFFLNKDVIIFHPHRNSSPFLNSENRKNYFFINPNLLWKLTIVFGRTSKLRDYAIYSLLSIINPKFIIDINWIAHIHTIYFVWAKNHNKNFIVIQHGTYVGGVVTDAGHRFTKCQEFWVWSHFFQEMFSKLNSGKNVKYKVIGNPVYNDFDRSKFTYKSELGNKILVAPSFVNNERFDSFVELIQDLEKLGFEVTVKQHAQQAGRYKSFQWNKMTNDGFYELMVGHKYDFVITDVSSAMNDIIFFKNKAVFFSPPGDKEFYTKNLYSDYMLNLYDSRLELHSGTIDLHDFFNIENQEKLLLQLSEFHKNTIN